MTKEKVKVEVKPRAKAKVTQATAPAVPPSVLSVPKKAKIESVKGVKLMNTSGKEVKKEDYFFNGIILPSFENTCGRPVDREDLITVFNKVFKPTDNILFYRQPDKEVYIIIVPIKYSTEVLEENNSIVGDFHKHAISFLNEGSVNLDSLRTKLEKIKTFLKFTDR